MSTIKICIYTGTAINKDIIGGLFEGGVLFMLSTEIKRSTSLVQLIKIIMQKRIIF